MYEIRIDGIRELAAKLGLTRDATNEAIRQGFRKNLEDAKLLAQDRVRRRSGALAASIEVRETESEDIDFALGSDLPYARYNEYGTLTRGEFFRAAVRIFPTHSYLLHWVDLQTGGHRFAASVLAKGMRAEPFIRPAIQFVKPFIKSNIRYNILGAWRAG